MTMKTISRTIREARKNVRRWGKLWRVMKRRRDRQGAKFAVARGRLWRDVVNRLEKITP